MIDFKKIKKYINKYFLGILLLLIYLTILSYLLGDICWYNPTYVAPIIFATGAGIIVAKGLFIPKTLVLINFFFEEIIGLSLIAQQFDEKLKKILLKSIEKFALPTSKTLQDKFIQYMEDYKSGKNE